MPLESASYIDDLDVSNPAATDQLQQGDDHLRLIKAVLKNTFPNITGPVTASQDDINSPASSTPVGCILLWYGTSAAIPSGYALCDGSTVNKSDGSGTIVCPDLRNRFVIGAGTLVAQGATGGSATSAVVTDSAGAHVHTVPGVGAHTHTFTASGTSGSTAATINLNPTNGSNYDSGGGSGTPVLSASPSSPAHTHAISVTGTTDSGSSGSADTGSSGAHSHTGTVATVPPAMGLHYIMKV